MFRFARTLAFTLLALTIPVGSASAASTYTWWGKLYTADNRGYMINSAYNAPTGTKIGVWLNSNTNWGGEWDFYGKTGGIAPMYVVGKWPWEANATANSGLPVQVRGTPYVKTNWSYSKGAMSGRWDMFFELWTHNSTSASSGNITCDIMINPDYSALPSTNYKWDTTLSGINYAVYYYGPASGRSYPIVHFYRRNKTTATGDLYMDDFWEYCAKNGWCSWNDWVGSITAGAEPFSGKGSYATNWFANTVYGARGADTTVLVPEPGTLALVAGGGLIALRRRGTR
jgi:hypothetical protein